MFFSKKSLTLSLFLVFCLAFTGCQNKSSSLQGEDDDDGGFAQFPSGNFFPSGPGGTGGGTIDLGSGSGGGVTEADKQALVTSFQAFNDIVPQAPDTGLSQALQAEAQRILAEEQAGRDVAVKKMLLAGKMLQECAKRVSALSPRPGQPLLGAWNGGGACKVNFTVSGSGGSNFTYSVTGGTKGTMKASANGKGAIQGKPFSGNLTDSPRSGKGSLIHPTFHRTKHGTKPCTTQVALKTPTSPIPKNYQEAMKQAGKCFRQTLVLMSPVFDDMFRRMDPQMAALLQARFLGIGR